MRTHHHRMHCDRILTRIEKLAHAQFHINNCLTRNPTRHPSHEPMHEQSTHARSPSPIAAILAPIFEQSHHATILPPSSGSKGFYCTHTPTIPGQHGPTHYPVQLKTIVRVLTHTLTQSYPHKTSIAPRTTGTAFFFHIHITRFHQASSNLSHNILKAHINPYAHSRQATDQRNMMKN